MSVSSVKNLNGETFSAVQDAYLTYVVSNNSANWNEISAYQANSGNYQLTTGMTAYANSAEVTGTAQYGLTTAGWSEITGGGSVPTGVMTESGLEYDASGNISAYSGSAFAAQLPEEEEVEFEELDISSISAATDYISANSANIDATVTNVSANSGVWGGSALPISAGPGIKFEMVDNTLVASTDETVLWSGDASAFSLSEAATGFDNLQITYYPTEGGTACSTVLYVPSTASSINLFSEYIKITNDFIIEDVTKFITNDYTNYSYAAGAHAWYSTLMERQGGAGGDCFNRVTKVVGINRIAGE